MEDKIINNYIPASYCERFRLFHESDVKKMLQEQKEILIQNWSKNCSDIEWTVFL